MSDAFNAGAWILGEMDDHMNWAKNYFLHPVKFKVDNIEDVNIGDPADVWMRRVDPKLFDRGDDSLAITLSSTNYMMPENILKVMDNGDGTKTAFFTAQAGIRKWTFNEDWIAINYEVMNLYNYLGYSATAKAGYLYDSFCEEDTNTEWFLCLSSRASSVTDGFIHKKREDVVTTYKLTTTKKLYMRSSEATSSDTNAEKNCNGNYFKKIGENLFLIGACGAVIMVRLDEVLLTAVEVGKYTASVKTASDSGAKTAIFVDSEKSIAYFVMPHQYFFSTDGTQGISVFIVSFDVNTYTFTLINSATVYKGEESNRWFDLYTPKNSIVFEDSNKVTIPVYCATFETSHMALFIDIDIDNSIKTEVISMPTKSNYSMSSVVFPDSEKFLCSYTIGGSNTYFAMINRSGCYTVNKVTTSTGYAYRIGAIDGRLFAFWGRYGNGDSKGGTGTCSKIRNLIAAKVGVVIDKNNEEGLVEVAQTGVVRTTVDGYMNLNISDVLGESVHFVDKNLVELS